MRIEFKEDLPFLLNRKKEILGVMLGVKDPKFIEYFLNYWAGEKLYVIDSWTKGCTGKYIYDHNGQLDNLSKTFEAVYDHDKRVAIIKAPLVAALGLFKPESLDFLCADIGCCYQDQKTLFLWFEKIKKTGTISGFDFFSKDEKEEIRREEIVNVCHAVGEKHACQTNHGPFYHFWYTGGCSDKL